MANSGRQLLTITERLPPETMSEIFISCISLTMITHNWDDDDFQRGISIPLTLSSVCRLWRSIAHSTLALWTSFGIYLPSRDFPQRIQQAQQWLSRSGQLPLSIQIYSHPSVPLDRSDPLVGELIDLVNNYSHRWETLKIKCSIRELLHLFSKSTPILKTLILSDNRGTSRTFDDWLFRIHWNNINRFTVCDIAVSRTLEILRLSPQLQECFLTELWMARNEDTLLPSRHLLHTRLETLHVHFQSKYVLNNLLDCINLPSLENFKYNGPSNNVSTRPCDSLVAFLNRSACSLKTFSLQSTMINQEGLIRILFAMPHLETMNLGPDTHNFPYVTDRILNILADTAVISARLNDQPDGPFLPKLRSFSYIGRYRFSWKCIPTVFGQGIKEPGAPPKSDQRPLRSFRMDLFHYRNIQNPEADIVAVLKRLRAEEGYEIQILQTNLGYLKAKRDLLHGEFI